MPKKGTEYELFVKSVYECLNRADGLSDVQIQHDVKLVVDSQKNFSQNHKIIAHYHHCHEKERS